MLPPVPTANVFSSEEVFILISSMSLPVRLTTISKSCPKAFILRSDIRSQQEGIEGVIVKLPNPVGLIPNIPSVMMRQIGLMMKYKDPHIALLESRKHTAWYMRGLEGAAALRRMCGEIKSIADIEAICEKALEQNRNL